MKSLLLLIGFFLFRVEAKTLVVKIEATKFFPEKLEAKVGDTILWDNKDFFPHTATAVDKSFNSNSIPSMKSWSFKVQKKGTYHYKCLFHPVMSATLIVR